MSHSEHRFLFTRQLHLLCALALLFASLVGLVPLTTVHAASTITIADAGSTTGIGNSAGGNPASSLCPAGAALTGVSVTVGGSLQQATSLCNELVLVGSDVSPTGGGSSGPTIGSRRGSISASSSCPSGQVVVGFGSRSGLLIDGVAPLCQVITGTSPTGPVFRGTYVGRFGGTANANILCPAGAVAIGIDGRAGDALDYFSLRCGRIYNWAGFLQPVDNLPTVNKVKAGSAIPVKFSLGSDQGLDIFVTDSPTSQGMTCDTGDPTDSIEQTVTAGQSGLSYDASTDTYTYVWKTDKTWAGTCRQLNVRLDDGTNHLAEFTFTK